MADKLFVNIWITSVLICIALVSCTSETATKTQCINGNIVDTPDLCYEVSCPEFDCSTCEEKYITQIVDKEIYQCYNGSFVDSKSLCSQEPEKPSKIESEIKELIENEYNDPISHGITVSLVKSEQDDLTIEYLFSGFDDRSYSMTREIIILLDGFFKKEGISYSQFILIAVNYHHYVLKIDKIEFDKFVSGEYTYQEWNELKSDKK